MVKHSVYDAVHGECCPECKEPNEHLVCLNVRKEIFAVCEKHKVVWWVGHGLSDGFLDETEDNWERNAALIGFHYKRDEEPVAWCDDDDWEKSIALIGSHYKKVKPMHWICECDDCKKRRAAAQLPPGPTVCHILGNMGATVGGVILALDPCLRNAATGPHYENVKLHLGKASETLKTWYDETDPAERPETSDVPF